jgi:transmembrane 9 superfamily member 2/4
MYVGYMFIVSFSFFLITGSLGFLSCFVFVRIIYAAIKID